MNNYSNKANKKQLFFSKLCIKACLLGVVFNPLTHASAEWIKEDKADTLAEALREGKTKLNVRLRYEDARQGNQGAQALTLATRLSYETLPFELFNAFVEFNDVRAIPDDQNYFSGSNNQFDDLLIEDPEGTQLTQAWLAYDLSNTLFKYGRQSLALNNERFLGTQSLRQKPQAISGLSIQNESLNYTRFQFVQINQLHTHQDKDLAAASQDLNAKLFSLNYRGYWLNDLTLYGLWISDHPGQRQWESATYGVRYAGSFGGNLFSELGLDFQVELARQEDAGANPANYQLLYHLFDFTFSYQGLSSTIGHERLGASAGAFLVTPLGSLYEFQGANAMFNGNGLGNIPGGVRDTFVGLAYNCHWQAGASLLPLNISATYHDYQADQPVNGVKSLGDEWILGVETTLKSDSWQDLRIALQYAAYDADQFAQNKRTVRLAVDLAW